jgi:hypothetical protein
VGALVYAVNWWLYGRFWVVTNNAFVTGNLIPVYAYATGFIVQVYYEETEPVKKGDLFVPTGRASPSQSGTCVCVSDVSGRTTFRALRRRQGRGRQMDLRRPLSTTQLPQKL